MKKIVLVSAAVLLAGLASQLHSQWPSGPQTPLQQLQALKAKNQQLLEKQAATLQKLEEIELQSQQVKFLGKRS